jgi:hypothetical protein
MVRYNSFDRKLENPHNKGGSGRGKGTRARRAANQGTSTNKYSGMGEGDKEKIKSEGFDIDLVKQVAGLWIYGKVRFHNISFADEGYTKDELKFLYPVVKNISDFCRIQKQDRFHLSGGEVRRHYVHVESGGVVGAVMESGVRVRDKSRLDDLIPGVFEYLSGRDKVQ